MVDRIVREPERRAITGLGRTKWWELEKSGEAPLRVVITGNRIGWRLSQLQVWIKSRQPALRQPAKA